MTYETLKEAVLAVEENNKINDGKWSDWDDAQHIADTYDIELNDKEATILNKAIESNGKTLPTDLRAEELKELGQSFGGGGYWIDIIEQKYAE